MIYLLDTNTCICLLNPDRNSTEQEPQRADRTQQELEQLRSPGL
ncbi:hypothetical protein [Microcoleus sp. bin38.metabat.b11b12b14.051]|nr:hypothetical protein [Microcoleus sp. bin38.metabat.b11b12b14.051]